MKRGERRRLRWALATSALVHATVITLAWAAARNAPALPRMRVYAVDIVSPPPQLAGEANPGAGGEPVVAEEPPAPEPEPTPPAPEPAPPPPKKEPAPPKPKPREPSPPAKTTKQPAPTPAKESKPAAKPAPDKPTRVAGGGEGGGSGASRGAKPDPASAGGEGLDVQLKGVQCPSPDYCANIVRQLYRHFRPPADASGDAAEVFFWINRDGSVSDIKLVRSSGSFRFRVAAMEAVEQAGLNRAFGALPKAFEMDRLPVSFYFRPAR